MTQQPGKSESTMRAGATLHAGRYRLSEKLGQGGMGSVYLAEDTLLPGRLVAVKENADTSAAAQSQFKREALLLARLRHPNLPQVMDYFIEADGKQYLVMDYVPGDNLMELMRKRQGPLPAAEALAIVEQVMQALTYMHTWRDPKTGQVRPIIHRDIKPANIKRTPDGRIFLVDFGIAKVEGGTMTGTAVSAKALTPGYAPLEQYHGGTDARSDIYSLGATLYALLTGRAPPNATALATGTPLPPLQSFNASVPTPLTAVVQRAMQQLPANRYQSIAEMQLALAGRAVAGKSGKSGASSIARAVKPRAVNASTLVALLLLLGAVLSMAGIGFLLSGTQTAQTPPGQTQLVTANAAGAVTASSPTMQRRNVQGAALAAEPSENAPPPSNTPRATAAEKAITPETATHTRTPRPAPTAAPTRPPATRLPPADATATAAAVAANLRAVSASLSAVLQPAGALSATPAAGVWALVASSTARNLEQTWLKSAAFPGDAIRAQWQEGNDVTLLTYGDGSWVFFAARLPGNPQQYFQTSNSFPGSLIREKWQEGYDISSIAYGAGQWAVVMTQGEQNLEQAFFTNPQFPVEQIREHWEDGYAVTDLAYGAGSWVVVASKLDDDPLQRYATSTDFPGEQIQTLWSEGFDVTSLAYGNGLWAYIASKSAEDIRQTYATNAAFPADSISELWADGYDVTNLAFGTP